MNPTHVALTKHHHMHKQYRRRRLAKRARADVAAPPPPTGIPYRGEQEIATSAYPCLTAFPYYCYQTQSAMLIAALAIISALLPIPLFGYSIFTISLTLGLLGVAALGVYCAWFRRWSPAIIDAKSLEAARSELDASGDAHAEPLGLIEQLVLGLLLGIDGCLAGAALFTTAFAAIFTPTMALAAAAAWGVATAYLLWKASRAAALEAAIQDRRTLIRNLSSSTDPANHQRASAMKAAIGDKLQHDYSNRANTTSARWILAIVVTVLAVGIFVIRINTEADEASTDFNNTPLTQLGQLPPSPAASPSAQYPEQLVQNAPERRLIPPTHLIARL